MTPEDLNLAYGAVLSVLNNPGLEWWHKPYRELAKRMEKEMKIVEPCPHHTPNAGGTIDSELHGVCIFCYRDRGAAFEKRVELLENQLESKKAELDAWQDTLARATGFRQLTHVSSYIESLKKSEKLLQEALENV